MLWGHANGWMVLAAIGGCDGDKAGPGSDPRLDTETTDTDTDTETGGETVAPDQDGDGVADEEDCDDADPSVYPGAPDLCDGRVTDCRRTSDDGLVNLDGTAGFDRLQDALDAARSGAELVLCPGTYAGDFVAAVPVRLVALEDRETTILAGLSGLAPTLTVAGGTEIVGLTVQGGRGGVTMSSPGTLWIEASRITGNEAEDGGGLIVAPDSVATLADTEITDNDALDGGGGAWVQSGSTLELTEGSVVTGNRAGEYGGGVWLEDAHLVGGVVSDNITEGFLFPEWEGDVVTMPYAALGGAGVALTGTGSVTGTEITGNEGAGAGVSVNHGTGTLTDLWVHDNDASHGLYGGGLVVAVATAIAEGTTVFERNNSTIGGGGYLIGATLTGGTFADNSSDGPYSETGGLSVVVSEVYDAVIRGNVGGPHGGGGVTAQGTALLDGVTIEGNVSPDHGGGVSSDADLQIVDCSIVGNEAPVGGGIWTDKSLTLTDSSVVDNVATVTGGGLHLLGAATVVQVNGGEITGNTAGSGGGAYVEATFGTASLLVTGTDFGGARDDNGPEDVWTAGAAFHGYGAGATFACDTVACSPAP